MENDSIELDLNTQEINIIIEQYVKSKFRSESIGLFEQTLTASGDINESLKCAVINEWANDMLSELVARRATQNAE